MKFKFSISLLLLLLLPAVAPGQDAASPKARITFTKEFPGSAPAYYSVAVTEDGHVVYATEPDDKQPVSFQLSPAVTRQIFETAERLNFFKGAQLETKKKVANMGKKTVRYSRDGVQNEAVFNYTENLDAAALAAIFEKISITEQHLMVLDRVVRFDKLGVMKQLLAIESSMDRKDIIEPGQFVPLLERVAGSTTFMNIARERANYLLSRIKTEQQANLR